MMKVNVPSFPLLLALVLGAAGCAGSRPALERDLPSAFPNHTAEQIRYELTAPHASLDAFSAKSSLVIRAPENGGSFSADMRDRRGDSLYVSISPGLGIEAARALVTPDSFFFYDRLKNRLTYGSLADAAGILPEPFTSDDLFTNLLGLPVPDPAVAWDLEADDELYYLRSPDDHTLYVVDPALWRVRRYERRDAAGDLTDRWVFSEFDEFDGTILPRRLLFERPQDDRLAQIYYRNLDLTPGEMEFDLEVRRTADRVRVGQ